MNAPRRYSSREVCPVCGGRADMPRGDGVRCAGFFDSDPKFVHCTREEHAGALPVDHRTEPPSFLHRIDGACRCGVDHAPRVADGNGQGRIIRGSTAQRAELGPAIAEYIYRDADGRTLYRITRHDEPEKTFRQWTPDGRGGWQRGLHGTQRTLYRLPELLDALTANPRRWVFVVEGEKDADRLASLGLVATTTSGGAGKWVEDGSGDVLRNARVVVLPDNDPAGWRHHLPAVAAALTPLVAELRVLGLPGLGVHDDVSDWLDEGHTVDELKALVLPAPPYSPVMHAPSERNHDNVPTRHEREATPRGFEFVTVAELLREPPESVEWVVDGLLPTGGVAVIGAKPKVGKTTLARCLALAVAKGQPFLGRQTTQGTTIYLALEDQRDRIRAHFANLGAGDDPLIIHARRAPMEALTMLRAAIDAYRPRCVVIDPLFRFAYVKDVSNYAEVNALLEDFVDTARTTGTAMVLVHHNNKAGLEGGDALLGSTAIFGAVDTAILMKRRQGSDIREVETQQRHGDDMDSSIITLDDHGRVRIGASVVEFDRATVARAILDALADRPRTERELHDLIAPELVGKMGVVLRGLVRAGEVEREGGGRRGSPFTYKPRSGPPPDWVLRAFG